MKTYKIENNFDELESTTRWLDELHTSPDVLWIRDDEIVPITIISDDEFKVTDPLQAIQIDRDDKINEILK